MNEYEEKETFVKELGELYSKYQIKDITAMEYHHHENGEEIITIHIHENIVYVNVSCDSLQAIINDIHRAL